MTTAPQDNAPADAASSATANSPPRRRLRKRWIILATFCALVATSGWLILRDEPLAVMKLPDGRTFTIHKLTYGREHSYHGLPAALTPVELWLNRQLARFGRQIMQTHSAGSFSNGPENSVCVWHSFDWARQANDSSPHVIVLTDGHGWRTSMSTQHLQNVPPPPVFAGQLAIPSWVACALPSLSSGLQVELFNASGNRLAATRIPYAIPIDLQQTWTAQTLPVTETDGNMSVTLKGLNAEWVKSAPPTPISSDVLTVAPDYSVTINEADSTSWAPLSEGVPFFELHSAVVASVRSPQGTLAPITQCTVSPHEPLWKLSLPLTCRNPDEVASSDRVNFENVVFSIGQPLVADAPKVVGVGESNVRLLGAARAGSFEYAGAGEASFPMPFQQPIESWTGNQLKGTFQTNSANSGAVFAYAIPAKSADEIVRPLQTAMTVRLNFTAPRPHVVISLTESGDRFPFVVVKDENGRVLEGQLFNAQGLLVWLAKEAYDDVEQVDVTLLLQKPRVFTFVVPPPKMPPRPVAAAK